ncbi:diacylglycerol kinase [Aquamicrobium soli]|uniref:Diacylglycerol kinase n=1 Tax=Aquamicrobium soli TaxID=1811518 RepID=A0ABV7K7U7_9HYPH
MKNRPFGERIRFALCGVKEAWQRENSFRTQGVVAILVVVGLLALRIPLTWSAIVILAAALVLAMELTNAALEAMIDRLHPERHADIRAAKDMAAGSVFLASIAAVVVGLLMLFSLYSIW